ncbi:hypothetical protein [Actinomyces sp. oral taxon 448]|nr:hypothetical protein [Actinomyces sp. oral taxon 448]
MTTSSCAGGREAATPAEQSMLANQLVRGRARVGGRAQMGTSLSSSVG